MADGRSRGRRRWRRAWSSCGDGGGCVEPLQAWTAVAALGLQRAQLAAGLAALPSEITATTAPTGATSPSAARISDEHAGRDRRHLHRGLVGLDLEQIVARLHGVASRLEPLGDLALGDGFAELRHQHVHYCSLAQPFRSLPPCGGGLGRGAFLIKRGWTPTPDPSPQGGGEPFCICRNIEINQRLPTHRDVLRLEELLHAFRRALAADTRLLGAAERRRRIGDERRG